MSLRSATQTRSPQTHSRRRGGTSLIEVMMATLVMGVGVLGVMALFPVAYLRAIQASQLTNAVLLKERAEVVIDQFDLTSDLYIPQPDVGSVNRCLIDPLGGFSSLNNSYGIDGFSAAMFYTPGILPFTNPNYFHLDGTSTTDLGADIPLRRLSFVTGWTNPYTTITNFGSLDPDLIANNLIPVLDGVGFLDRWETVFSATPDSDTNTTVSFDLNTIDQNDLEDLRLQLAAGIDLRLVLVDITGKRSEVRFPTTINQAPVVGGIEWGTNLSAGMGAIAECRVEVPDRRFTWMLTVRKTGSPGGSTVDIDCVVFHNRPSLDPEEELVHTAVLNAAGGAIYDVTFTPYPSDNTLTPPLRKGGYVFDPAHARWYRVLNIEDETATFATITLDRFPTDTITDLTIPRGVVAVFPLRQRIVNGR